MDIATFCYADFLKRLQVCYKQIAENIRAREVAAILFQRDALTRKELETIQQKKSDTKAAEILLHVVMSQSRNVYDCFLEALTRTSQCDIVLTLVDIGITAIRRIHSNPL